MDRHKHRATASHQAGKSGALRVDSDDARFLKLLERASSGSDRASRASRKILIHINNTNPALLADSPERQAIEAAGWRVAYDGMEITLP